MKSTLVKSYRVRLEGNIGKANILQEQLCILNQVSDFIFDFIKQNKSFSHKIVYQLCREKFPVLKSKVLQNFIRLKYFKFWNKVKQPIKASLLLDFQNFSILYDEKTVFSNYWLRLFKHNYPLRGKYCLEKIKPDLEKVKLIEIFYDKRNKLVCKLVVSKEIEVPDDNQHPTTDVVGLDINAKRVVLSNNRFYHLKRWYHRKIEYKHNHLKTKDLSNFTKDFFHKLSSKISLDLSNTGTKVLFLEDLKNIRRSASKKNGTSKGKQYNYIINNCLPNRMFQSFLKYKLAELDIKVVFISPEYTSQTCSRCGTVDPKSRSGKHFCCTSCNFKLDADLNASRNICARYISANALPVNLAHNLSINQI